MMFVPYYPPLIVCLSFSEIQTCCWLFCNHTWITETFPFHSWLRPPLASYQCHYSRLPWITRVFTDPGLILHLHRLCGLLLFRRVCKCTQHHSRAGNKQRTSELFSWKLVLLLCLITTIKAQFFIHARTQRELFKGQSGGLQLACQNYTFSLNTRLLHIYGNDKSESREHLMEPHSPLLTGFMLMFCMCVFLMRTFSCSWVLAHRGTDSIVLWLSTVGFTWRNPLKSTRWWTKGPSLIVS